MAYEKEVRRYNTAEAQALLGVWNNANYDMEQCKKRMQETEALLIKHVCPYKVGEVFANSKGKKFVLIKISVDTCALRGGLSGDSYKYVDFIYTFVNISKDGRPLLDSYSWLDIEKAERTGETIKIE